MQKENPKTRCEKMRLAKSADVCRFYGKVQARYGEALQMRDDVESFRVNVPLDGFELGTYTTDFLAKKVDGSYMVRECVERRYLTKPLNVRLMDASREYWARHGITDWGIVTDREGA